MATPTLLDLITEGMIDIGELGAGETPSPEDGAYIMGKANEWLDSLQVERLNIYEEEEVLLNLTAKQSFQIGPGAADFPNNARPIKIDACVILVPVNGVNIQTGECDLVPESRWREITDKSATSNVPEFCYFDYGWPFGTLNFYPAPLCAVATIAQLSVWLPLQQFASLTDAFAMPYSYQKAFVDGLKVVIMMAYGHPVDQVSASMESTTKQRLQQLNLQLPNIGLTDGIQAPPPNAPPQQ